MAFAALLPALLSGGISLGSSLYGSHQAKKQERRAQRGIERGTGAMGGAGESLTQPGKAGYDVFSTLNPQQSSALQQILSSLSGQGAVSQSPLYKAGQAHIQNILGGDTGAFEAPLMRQFNEQIIPGLAERFSGAGAGAQSSSAFQQALGGAGSDLAERLGALRGSLQQGAATQALGYAQAPAEQLQNLLGMQTQAFAPKQMGFGQSLGLGLAGGVGQGIGTGLSSPEVWKFLSSLFQKKPALGA